MEIFPILLFGKNFGKFNWKFLCKLRNKMEEIIYFLEVEIKIFFSLISAHFPAWENLSKNLLKKHHHPMSLFQLNFILKVLIIPKHYVRITISRNIFFIYTLYTINDDVFTDRVFNVEREYVLANRTNKNKLEL